MATTGSSTTGWASILSTSPGRRSASGSTRSPGSSAWGTRSWPGWCRAASTARLPLALVVVNVAACGVVALAGGFLARSAGRHALWGLVFAGYWGYLWTIGRDLTELTAAAFVLLGVAALVRGAPLWSGLAFLCAVLSKETSVLLVATLALVALWQRYRSARAAAATTGLGGTLRQLTLRRSDAAFVIPLLGFVAWQVVLLTPQAGCPSTRVEGRTSGSHSSGSSVASPTICRFSPRPRASCGWPSSAS